MDLFIVFDSESGQVIDKSHNETMIKAMAYDYITSEDCLDIDSIYVIHIPVSINRHTEKCS